MTTDLYPFQAKAPRPLGKISDTLASCPADHAASWEQSHTRLVGCRITLLQDDLAVTNSTERWLFSSGCDERRDGTCVETCFPPCAAETSSVSLFPLAGTWAQAPCCLLGAQYLPSGCPEVLVGAKGVDCSLRSQPIPPTQLRSRKADILGLHPINLQLV